VTGEALARTVLAGAGLGARVAAAEVMTTAEFDQRLGMAPLPELLSVTEAAAVIGVSGARVRQLLDEGRLAGTKIGATWAVPRTAAEARATVESRASA
jgi:excisionase family DNA binding protein